MEATESTQTRVRMNCTTTTKGLFTFDITSEAADIETAKANLSKAVDAAREVMTSKGYKEAEIA